MQEAANLIGMMAFHAMLGLCSILPLAIVIGSILHYTLLIRLDPILFREPYFHKKELGVFLVWPFTMMKATMYILLIAWPGLAKYKRFQGFDDPLPVEKPLIVLCYIELFLLGALFIGWFLVMAAAAFLWLAG